MCFTDHSVPKLNTTSFPSASLSLSDVPYRRKEKKIQKRHTIHIYIYTPWHPMSGEYKFYYV